MISKKDNKHEKKENKINLGTLQKQYAVCNLHLYTPTMNDDDSYRPIADENGEVMYYGKSYYET